MKFKTYPNLLMLLFVIGVLLSCKSSIPLAKESTKTVTITEVVRDTVVVVEADKSTYQALLKCQEGKVVIDQTTATQPKTTGGKKLSAPKVNIKDNTLKVDCEQKAYELFHQWKEVFKAEAVSERIPYPVQRELTFWQKLFIWFGKVFLILLLAALINWLIKLKKT